MYKIKFVYAHSEYTATYVTDFGVNFAYDHRITSFTYTSKKPQKDEALTISKTVTVDADDYLLRVEVKNIETGVVTVYPVTAKQIKISGSQEEETSIKERIMHEENYAKKNKVSPRRPFDIKASGTLVMTGSVHINKFNQ